MQSSGRGKPFSFDSEPDFVGYSRGLRGGPPLQSRPACRPECNAMFGWDGQRVSSRISTGTAAVLVGGAVILRTVHPDELPPSGHWWPANGSKVYDARGTAAFVDADRLTA